MKKLILTLALVAGCASVFAQGRVNFNNDSLSLITLSSTPGTYLAADAALAGQAVGNLVPLPSGLTLWAGLYGGNSQGSLFLYSVTALNSGSLGPGSIPATHVQLAANANGAPLINPITAGTAIGASTPWFQIRVWDSRYATYEAAFGQAGAYTGESPEFQMNPGSIAYINVGPAGANSTWVESPIVVGMVPEPSTFALAGLGAAAMLIFRRRK